MYCDIMCDISSGASVCINDIIKRGKVFYLLFHNTRRFEEFNEFNFYYISTNTVLFPISFMLLMATLGC